MKSFIKKWFMKLLAKKLGLYRQPKYYKPKKKKGLKGFLKKIFD
jgi:hypothetical protein